MVQSKCPGKMVELSTAEGVTVDFCPQTKGILFDPGEVAAYFELSEDLPSAARAGAVPTGQVWSCPKHPNSLLREVRFPKLDDLMLDICDEGGCVWFDRGEIPRFEALTARLEHPRSRLLRVFQQLRGTGYEVLGLGEGRKR